MKSKFLHFISMFVTSSFLMAQAPANQEVISIPSGTSNAGLLETTINGDVDASGDRLNPNRIYLLEPGLHFMYSAINVTNDTGTIKIHGSTVGKKPVVVPYVNAGVAPGSSMITSSLELKNLHIQGRNDQGGTTGGYFFQVTGNDRSIHVEDCLVEYPQRFIKAQAVPQGLTMTFKNNYFRDMFVSGQQWAGNVIDAKGVPVESFIFENNTVSNAGCPVLLQNQVVKYALINHNTFVNTSTFWNLNPYFYEAYITNNLFYNANMMGEDYNYLMSNPGQVSFPIMAFAPISLDGNASTSAIPADMLNASGDALVAPYNDVANYKIYVADNIYHNESSLDSYYDGDYNTIATNPISYLKWHGVDGPHDVNVPANWMAARETNLFANNASWVEENNILNQDPQLATVALSTAESVELAIKLRKWYSVPDESRTEDVSSIMFGDFDANTIPGAETEDGDGITKFSDLIEDFSIASSFVSNIDGHAIGALHWTNQIDSYDSAQALASIQSAYSSTLSVVDVIDSDNITSLVTFPNPFGNNFNIKFNITSKSDVKVSLYTITGAKVATFVNDTLNSGSHQLNFDTTTLREGLYLCKIEAGQYTKTFKVIKSE
ncbi:MAG: T9SS type A sorting domain-containing protein [Crocinitomicaceae bacterium]|nr:T9SS type A sorting domain-containing protein [Crocinitomicaceae bacterium]